MQEDLVLLGTAFFASLSLWRRMGDAGQGLTLPRSLSVLSAVAVSRWRVGTSAASTEG